MIRVRASGFRTAEHQALIQSALVIVNSVDPQYLYVHNTLPSTGPLSLYTLSDIASIYAIVYVVNMCVHNVLVTALWVYIICTHPCIVEVMRIMIDTTRVVYRWIQPCLPTLHDVI